MIKKLLDITHTQAVRKDKQSRMIVVISLLLSGINIHSVASLEPWTENCGQLLLLLFYLIGFTACFLLSAYYLHQPETRCRIHALLWGLPAAAAYVLGCRMRRDGTALAGFSQLPALLLQTGFLSVLAASCITPILQGFSLSAGNAQSFLQGVFLRLRSRHGADTKRQAKPAWQVWLFSTAVILVCWIPVFLAYYPSVFAYDAEGQLYQVLAHDYSTHHPLLHTIFLGSFFRLGENLPGSYQTGMALHSIVQMLLMACAFGYALAFLASKGTPARLRAVLLLFYALFPTNSILALSTTKDVLFSAFVLLHTLCIYQIAAAKDSESVNRTLRMDVLWTVLMLLFRNNALYAFLPGIPVICFLLCRKVKDGIVSWRRYLLCALLALSLFAVGSITLQTVLDSHNGSPREMLSIPLQQMARTRVKAEETLSPEIRQELDKYLPAEWVLAAYNPYLADPVKNRAVIHDDPAGLVKIWLRLGLQHPQIYIDAFLDNTVGYWFLEDQTHAQIYGLGRESGFGYLSTDNRTMPAGFEITEHSFLPGLRYLMEGIISDNTYQKIPVLRILFAPAFYWWLLCLYMAVVIYRRQYRLLLPAVLLVGYYLTLLLSPAVLIRYMYPYVVTTPVLCCLLFCPGIVCCKSENIQ